MVNVAFVLIKRVLVVEETGLEGGLEDTIFLEH